MGLNFEELSDQLEQLLHETLGTEYLINSFYRISKATPEQTKPYFLLKHNIPTPIIILVHLIQIPLNLIKLTCGLVLGLIFRYQYGIFESKIRNQKSCSYHMELMATFLIRIKIDFLIYCQKKYYPKDKYHALLFIQIKIYLDFKEISICSRKKILISTMFYYLSFLSLKKISILSYT